MLAYLILKQRLLVSEHVTSLCSSMWSLSPSLHHASASRAFGGISPFLWRQKMFVLFLQRHLEVCRGQHDETTQASSSFSPLSKTGSLSLLICITESKKWPRPRCHADFLDAKLVDWDFSGVYCATCPDAQTSATLHAGCLSKKFFMKTKMNETQRYKDFMVFFMFVSNLL